MSFPKDFIFGVATASYQIEGAGSEDGRTDCIWDTFARIPGNTFEKQDGSEACDHYHRYKEDIQLMKELGVDSYRLSIAWPRIFPRKGVYNPKGMEFYKNLCAELKKNGLKIAVTLYHWDLPQWAQDLGGWNVRECVDWYLEYAAKCFEELGGTVDQWITHNEPFCASFLGNFVGCHAPGHHDMEEAMRVAHHLLLSHGRAVRMFREMNLPGEIGITLNLSIPYPETDSFADKIAQAMHGGHTNRWFLEPLFRKSYPIDMAVLYAARTGTDYKFVEEGDFEIIASPMDFLGVNYYSRALKKYDSTQYLLSRAAYSDYPKTAMGWDVSPEAMTDLLSLVRSYTDLPVIITENGSAWEDKVEEGRVHDDKRVDFLMRHLNMVDKLNDEGMNIKGYYAWSMMDNYEWAFGYSKRFGLIYVDYETQERIRKDSYFAYQKFIAEKRGR